MTRANIATKKKKKDSAKVFGIVYSNMDNMLGALD